MCTATDTIELHFATADEILDKQLDKLVWQFRKTHPEFISRYRGARADYDAAVARYDATLVTALHETADAVASRTAMDARLAELRRALISAEDARRIARLRYQGGLSNQLPVLTADDTLVGVRRAVTDAESRRTALDIALIRALGGGYRDTKPASGAK